MAAHFPTDADPELRTPFVALLGDGHDPDVENDDRICALIVRRAADLAELRITAACEKVAGIDLFVVGYYYDESADGETISAACDTAAILWLAAAFKRCVIG